MAPVRSMLLFGATGDLAGRMLFPSLYGLYTDGLIADDISIVATAHTDLDNAGFRTHAAAALRRHLPTERLKSAELDRFIAQLRYVRIDARRSEDFGALAAALGDRLGEEAAIFLSTAPSLFQPMIAGLTSAGLSGPNMRLALEKPLGSDLKSSGAINDAVAASFPEGQTFRIDHYLGKETVQNLLALRFGNALFEPLWNARGVRHVEITVAETVGLEGRISYFDGAGALRDMVQNHMLQLLALIAMEPPATFGAEAVRDEKVKVLRALRPMERQTIMTHSAIGQYVAGAIDGVAVAGYADELGRSSSTETFVALKAHVDNWRWAGTPFYLRTGKRMQARYSQIVIQFHDVPHAIFGKAAQPNRLVIRLQPDETIRLLLMAKQPGLDRAGIRLREVPLDLGMSDAFADARRRIAYERLLLDLIEGDPTLFVRRDEVEAQWQWIDGIRDGWAHAGVLPKPYSSGTTGPASAITLAERDGVSWYN